MIRSLVVTVLFGMVGARSAGAQSSGQVERPYPEGFFVTAGGGKLLGFPMSYGPEYLDRFPSVDADERGYGSDSFVGVLGGGVNFLRPGKSLGLRIEADLSRGTFSDWRVEDRSVIFFLLSFDLGWKPSTQAPVELFGGFSAGMLHQSEHAEYVPAPDPADTDYGYLNEFLQQTDYLIAFGLGASVAVGHGFALRTDIKIQRKDEGGCGGGGGNVVVVCDGDSPPAPSLGNRWTLGVLRYF